MIRPITKVLGCSMDTSDNIPGLPGAGAGAAAEFLEGKPNPTLKDVAAYYIKWFTQVIPAKKFKKQMAEYLKQYKIDNDMSRFTAATKKEAIVSFVYDGSEDLTAKDALVMYSEMYALVYMLRTEAEGLKHGFKVGKVQKDSFVDWENVVQYESILENEEDELDDIDMLEDL